MNAELGEDRERGGEKQAGAGPGVGIGVPIWSACVHNLPSRFVTACLQRYRQQRWVRDVRRGEQDGECAIRARAPRAGAAEPAGCASRGELRFRLQQWGQSTFSSPPGRTTRWTWLQCLVRDYSQLESHPFIGLNHRCSVTFANETVARPGCMRPPTAPGSPFSQLPPPPRRAPADQTARNARRHASERTCLKASLADRQHAQRLPHGRVGRPSWGRGWPKVVRRRADLAELPITPPGPAP